MARPAITDRRDEIGAWMKSPSRVIEQSLTVGYVIGYCNILESIVLGRQVLITYKRGGTYNVQGIVGPRV